MWVRRANLVGRIWFRLIGLPPFPIFEEILGKGCFLGGALLYWSMWERASRIKEHQMLTATWHRGPYTVKGEWCGGAYVDITLPECEDASDCINVWDYETGAAEIPFTQEALDETLIEWCESLFGGDDDELRKRIEFASW